MAIAGKLSEQQSNVYSSQPKSLLHRVRFFTHEEAQSYADRLTSSDWWVDRYSSIVRLEIQKAGNTRVSHAYAQGDIGLIVMSKFNLTLATLLHEAAHTVVPNGTGHGSAWVREFLTITYFDQGSDMYLDLFNVFTDGGVVF